MIKQTNLSTLLFPIFLFSCLLIFSACKKTENATTNTGNTGNTDTIDPAIYETDENGLTLHKNNRVISINLSEEDYDIFTNLDRVFPQKKRITKNIIYKRFKDDFDFMVFILNQPEIPKEWGVAGFAIPVQNQVKNIGTAEFSTSSDFGAEGKLKSVISLATPKTFLTGQVLLHEVCHLWGNDLIKDLDYPNYEIGPHWGVTGGNIRGQLGGFLQSSLTKIGKNKWSVRHFYPAAAKIPGPYSELELYLMGFIPLEQVTPFDSFKRINNVISITETKYSFTAGTRTRFTPESIREKFGVRTPLPSEAQKDFKMLVVVLTPKPLTEKQWENIDKQSELFGKAGDDGDPNLFNFWEATKGMGTMETGNLHKSLRRKVETTALEQIRRYDLQAPSYDLQGAVSSMYTGTGT